MIESIPSVTIAVRVKPTIKLILEDTAKKQGLKICQLLNHIILKELGSEESNDIYQNELDKLLIENKNLRNQINELQNKENIDNTLFIIMPSNHKGRLMESVLNELSIQVEHLKKIITEHNEEMKRQFKSLEAWRKAEQQLKRLNKRDQ